MNRLSIQNEFKSMPKLSNSDRLVNRLETENIALSKDNKTKENEINNLNDEQLKLKNQLDNNKLDYEKVIEKATNQIENFLVKINSENPLQ